MFVCFTFSGTFIKSSLLGFTLSSKFPGVLIFSVILECNDDEGVHISRVFLIDLGLCNYSVALLKLIHFDEFLIGHLDFIIF